ncbi:MAG: TAXI family TRAP transporter solute-binding subunit [Thermodesulfobacteriota bacterium]|nr:TAXI family TRAP transporter solute-binding subunit [Thermodesulfobacteriota bacterium]
MYTGQEKSARTFGTRAMLVVSNTMDQKTAFAIVKILYENKKKLQRRHPALSLYPVEESRNGITGIPLHKGAKQFFAE